MLLVIPVWNECDIGFMKKPKINKQLYPFVKAVRVKEIVE